MQTALLGKTGIRVSRLGLGTVKLGRDQSVKYPQPFAIPDDASALALLERARELGLNLLDTAPAYGVAEERLGRLLAGRWEGWVVCTKVGEEFEDGRSRHDFSAVHTRFSLERSLRRLRRDSLDLVLIHSDGYDQAALRAGAVEVLQEFCAAGKIRAWGASTKTVAGGLAALAAGADAVMVTYNPEAREEEPVLAAAAAAGAAILVKKGLASGHGDPRSSLRFCLAHPAVTSVVVGTINPHHLEENAGWVGG
jgi:aryl-alcohol dehydrogenase-like predicted oxidoreductase